MKNLVPTREQFEGLLAWLDPVRERAGERYEFIRKGLINIFIMRGCSDAEDLADETINRVMRKINEVKENYHGDPALYFYGVARNVLLEQRKMDQRQVLSNSIIKSFPALYSYDLETEIKLEVLDECLSVMAEDERALLLSYYEGEKKAKIDHRKALAQKFQLTDSALRKRIQRLKRKLEKCFNERLKRFPENESGDDT